MAASTHIYTFPGTQAEEDALHSQRLLQVEERPFHRLKGMLLGKDSLLKGPPARQLPSPPPEGDSEVDVESAGVDQAKIDKFRADILLEFSSLNASITRIQLLQSANARERERYAAEKASILATAQNVRENTLALRERLVEAQRVLEERKGYDELALKLMGTKGKGRQELNEEIVSLEKEVEELMSEGKEFEGVWQGRRDAFDRVVVEGQSLTNVIRGIKDDADGDERMEEEGEEGQAKEERSRMGTPAPEGRTPMAGAEGEDGSTPMVAGTPLPDEGRSPARATNKFLEVEDGGTRPGSSAGTPLSQPVESQGDVEMGEEKSEEHRGDDQPVEPPVSEEAQVTAEMETETVAIDELQQTQQQVEPATGTEVMDES